MLQSTGSQSQTRLNSNSDTQLGRAGGGAGARKWSGVQGEPIRLGVFWGIGSRLASFF